MSVTVLFLKREKEKEAPAIDQIDACCCEEEGNRMSVEASV